MIETASGNEYFLGTRRSSEFVSPWCQSSCCELLESLTGWRALRAAPRGPIPARMAQEGFEPSASLGLNESGLPVAYRAVGAKPIRTFWFPRTTQGGIRTHRRPGLSRAARPIGVPGLVEPARSHRRRCEAEAVGLEPTSGLRRHLFSRQAPDPAGWLPTVHFVPFRSVQFRGLESNQRPPRSERGVTTSSNCPGGKVKPIVKELGAISRIPLFPCVASYEAIRKVSKRRNRKARGVSPETTVGTRG